MEAYIEEVVKQHRQNTKAIVEEKFTTVINQVPKVSSVTYPSHEKSNTPFFYMLCLLCKKAYRELNLERASGEDTGPGDFSFLSSSSPLGQTAVSGNFTLHQ